MFLFDKKICPKGLKDCQTEELKTLTVLTIFTNSFHQNLYLAG